MTRTYTKRLHTAILSRIQNLLDFGLDFAQQHQLDSNNILQAQLDDGHKIEIKHFTFGEHIGYFILQWSHGDFIAIQYDSQTKKASDSTVWKNGNATHGHIQTAYTGNDIWLPVSQRTDPNFNMDFVGLIKKVENWSLMPKAKSVYKRSG